MVPRQLLREGAEADSQHQIKRRRSLSTIFKGASSARSLQEYVPSLEPLIRKWVQEAVDRAMDPFLGLVFLSSSNQIECSGSRTLQLQFQGNLPRTLFTGSRVLSVDKSPIKVVLCDSTSGKIVTSGPLSSIKANIVVLDGDFSPDDGEDWSEKDFESKIVQNREGKRPLVTGDLTVPLQNGVGCIGEVSFTDNSSWIRSGKFRLGAKVHPSAHEISIREAMSSPFKVKDHRGESYQKHYPPSLDDEVWRLDKIAKDGASHKRLNQFGISCVGDFLRSYITNELQLRSALRNVSNKTWETITRHAMTCTLDDKKYMYGTAQGTGLLFNSIYKVVGATFDGHSYQSVDSLNMYQTRMVEELKQHAYKNVKDWVSVCDQSIVAYPMLLENPADTFTNPNVDLQAPNRHFQQDKLEIQMNNHHRTISPPYEDSVEHENSSFELVESSEMQGFNPAFRNGFELSNSSGGFYIAGQTWATGGNYMESHLSTEDIPVDDNFQVESSAWHQNQLFLGSNTGEIGITSSNSGILIPRNRRPKTWWCKLLAVIKWQILVKRNVAARKWKLLYLDVNIS
ncbi:calmodulin-binding protein 60 C isoform X1 [Sesamum indicum]|uniref:Calmodulin-binding protein 60 C isoform X1 n=1 Tax=Sesamum indicum TaxID=4182 RepID=A0A8M8V6D8_SESIN|nr:calmodulin-binding protein 60 C isoform X1 [Sesamum indicum]